MVCYGWLIAPIQTVSCSQKGQGRVQIMGRLPPPSPTWPPHLADREALLVAGQNLCPVSWSCCCILVMNSRPIGWTSCVSKRVLLTIRKGSLKGGTWMQGCSFRWRGALGEGKLGIYFKASTDNFSEGLEAMACTSQAVLIKCVPCSQN